MAPSYYNVTELHQALFERAPDGVFIVNAQGHYIEANQRACAMANYTREELLALSTSDLVVTEELEPVPLLISELQSGETTFQECYLRCKDGCLLAVEINTRTLSENCLISTVRDISKRKLVEDELRESNERFRQLAESSLTGIYLIQDNLFRYVNPAMAYIFGYQPEEIIDTLAPVNLIYADDRPLVMENLRRRIEGEEEAIHYEFRGLHKDGSVIDIEVHGRRIEYGGRPGVIGSLIDITNRKQAEQERLAHLRFFENMDQINRAMQGTNDLEKMMRDILDTLLSIFECDRAWLVYPCDPEAAMWQVPMERTRAEYPSILPIGRELSLDPVGAEVFRILRAASGPVQFGLQAEHPVPDVMKEAFGVQSFMALALYPKVGLPWSFGLHQCSNSRVWNLEEVRLLQEIGWRLADGLTSLLSYRSLHESEERYRSLIQKVQTAIVLHDGDGRILTSNSLAQRMLGLSKDQLLGRAVMDREWHFVRQDGSDMPVSEYPVSLVLASQQPLRDYQAGIYRPDQDQVTWVLVNAEPEYDYEGKIFQIIVSFIDITALRQAENELRHTREAAWQFSEQLTVLQEITNQLSKVESSDNLCRQAVQLGRSYLGFDRASIWFIDAQQGIMRGSFGTDERGQLRDERDAQVKFRHEGLAWRIFSRRQPVALVEYDSLKDHLAHEVGEGDNAMAALWDGDEVIGVISVDNLFTRRPITERQLEILRLYATTLGHLITRKWADEARRASETRFRTFVNHAADAFFLHDEQGTILDVNRQACKSLGYNQDELIGMSPSSFDAGNDRDRPTVHQVESQLDVGEIVAFETQHRRKDGSVFPVEVRTRPFWQGEHRFAVSLARDMTERKRAEKALRDSERRLSEAQRIAHIGYWERNFDTNHIILSDEACRIFGLSTQGFPYDLEKWHQQWLKLLHPEDQPRTAQAAADALRDGPPYNVEYRIIRPDGEIRFIHSEATVNRDETGRPHYMLGMMQDITERRRAEEALSSSEAELRTLIGAMTDVIFVGNAEGRYLKVIDTNPSLLYKPSDELVGKTLHEVFPKDQADFFFNHIKHALHTQTSVNFEYCIPIGNNPLWFNATISPMSADMYLMVARDVTERKHAEEEVYRLNQELEQRVADRTVELKAANQELEAFAYSVSHDLRHIDGFLELLQKRLSGMLDERSQHYMGTISDSARHMGQLIDDLLAFSRMGRYELSKTIVDLNALIQDAIAELELETQGLQISWSIGELPAVSGDRAMLRLVLVNLISNALKFSRERTPVKIKIDYQVSQSELIISVQDNGVGFDMAYADKLFGVFQRLHRVEEFEGTGIGLANVHRIIQRHGGRVWAEGELDQGATFYFTLPYKSQKE